MAFDASNPTQLAALKTEVTTDPIAMGYDPSASNEVVKLLNDPDSNKGNETTNIRLTVRVLLDVMTVSDFAGNQVTDGERRFIESFLNRELDTDINDWREKIRQAFKTNSSTVTALDALTRKLSRAEVLFGEDTTLSRNDWLAARDS